MFRPQVLFVVIGLCLVPRWTDAETLDLEGTVKAVDATARTITIERKTPKGTKTLELEVNKKAGDLNGVKVGDRLSFSYDPDLEIVTRLGGSNGKATQSKDAASKTALASKGPGEREKEICKEVCRKLEQEHFLEPRIDRELASKMLDTFLRSLDPMKMYFLQSDIDSFKKEANDLPTALKQGDSSLAFTIYDKLLGRIEARLPAIESLIDDTHDFTKDESIETDQASTRWAGSDAESKDKWRRRIKYDQLVGKMQGEKEAALKERLHRRYRSLSSRWRQMTSDELLETFLSSLYSSVDGQSQYMSPETLANFEIGMRSQLDGIGAQLKGEDGFVNVVELTPGGAAAKDGRLKPGDRIISIAQGDSDAFVDTHDMRLNDVVDLVRGKRGTKVRLKVMSSGDSTPKVYDITRSKIELKGAEVTGEVLEAGRKTDGLPYRIGVIKVPAFYSDTDAMRRGDKEYRSASKDCKALLEGFRRQNVDCVVMDVSGNGGGMLQEVTASVGLFIDRGRVFQLKQKDGRVEKYDDKESGRAWSGPLVVLVSRQTRSAAELFAGAIQDHNRGVIVGDESTNGFAANMNVMPVVPEKQLGAVKVLWALLYRPSGESVQLKGVRSDVKLPSVLGYLGQPSEANGKAGGFDRLNRDGFNPEGQDLSDVTRSLQKKSAVRIEKDREYRAFVMKLQGIQKRNQAGRITLDEVGFEKAWNEGRRDMPSSTAEGNKSGLGEDFYMQEVLRVAADLAEELKTR
jgi:carboxyl-terminal processing protease